MNERQLFPSDVCPVASIAISMDELALGFLKYLDLIQVKADAMSLCVNLALLTYIQR